MPDWAKWLAFGGGAILVVVVLIVTLSGGGDSSTAAASTTTTAATDASTTSAEAATGTEAPTSTTSPTSTEAATDTLGPGEAPGEIFLESAEEEGPDSFAAGEIFNAPVVSTTSTLVTTTTTTEPTTTTLEGQVTVQGRDGGQPGLYGGTQDQTSCDADAMLAYLQANFAKAQAWVDAQNNDPNLLWGDGRTELAVVDLPAFFEELTPAILLEDTRVTNHGYRDGRPTGRQSVLQAGTAVLVDKYGVPRARCACGNPLIPPLPSPTPPVYVGPQWPRWSPVTVVIITPSPTVVTDIILINVYTGDRFTRPVGGRGDTDIVIVDVQPVAIAGTWAGTFVVTEIFVPESGTLPDGTPIDPGGYDIESCRAALAAEGALDADTAAALDQLESGLPMTATFTGTYDQPDTVTIVVEESGETQVVPWTITPSGGIAFDVTTEDGTISFIGGLEGNVIDGAWSSASPDGFELIGLFTLTKGG